DLLVADVADGWHAPVAIQNRALELRETDLRADDHQRGRRGCAAAILAVADGAGFLVKTLAALDRFRGGRSEAGTRRLQAGFILDFELVERWKILVEDVEHAGARIRRAVSPIRTTDRARHDGRFGETGRREHAGACLRNALAPRGAF